MMILLLAALMQPPGSPVKTLEKGSDSGVDDARQVTIRSATEWAALWQLHAGERKRPAVDFAREMVVGVFLGSRPTAGFDIEIQGTREENGALVVQYRETHPARGAMTAQVLTAPYHIVAVPQHAGAVKFERLEK